MLRDDVGEAARIAPPAAERAGRVAEIFETPFGKQPALLGELLAQLSRCDLGVLEKLFDNEPSIPADPLLDYDLEPVGQESHEEAAAG
jgi:hypothetical protein